MNTSNYSILLIISIVFLSSPAASFDSFHPWDYGNSSARENKAGALQKDLSMPASLMKGSIIIFSRYVSPVDGDRCSMYPTCAGYAREAFEKHGFIGGVLLTVDRLIHEGNEKDKALLVRVGDRFRHYDPLSNNDYWWN